MADLKILLQCTSCETFQPFDRVDDSRKVVTCGVCHKRHSVDSLHAVDPDERSSTQGTT